MSLVNPERLEEKIDRVAVGATEIHMGFGGVKFQTMMELMEFSKLMALSGLAVPHHLRNNPGACLAICTKALRFGFDPFALAEHSFAMSKEVEKTIEQATGGRTTVKEKIETIAYDSYVIRAIIEAHAPIVGRLKYEYVGEGDAMTCTVSAKLAETGETVSHTSPTLGQRKAAIGTSDKGNLKGSPLWITKPKVQIGYDTARDLCRLHFSEVLMGWYDKDEFEEYAKAATAKDITPASGLKERLAAAGERTGGFSHDHVQQQIEHTHAMTLDTGSNAAEPVQAGEAVEPAHRARRPRKAAPEPRKAPETEAKVNEPEPPVDMLAGAGRDETFGLPKAPEPDPFEIPAFLRREKPPVDRMAEYTEMLANTGSVTEVQALFEGARNEPSITDEQVDAISAACGERARAIMQSKTGKR